MPWWCLGCGERRKGDICKCGTREAEQIPPLDGMVEMDSRTDSAEILRVLCGSRAYGLEHEKSDYDYHGVFVVPTDRILTPWDKVDEVGWVEGEDKDSTSWEIGHFLKLAITSNPTILETFKAPVVKHNPWGDAILKLFPAVISRERIFQSYMGYALKQRKKFLERKDDRPMKFAVSLIRVQLHAIELLDTGNYKTDLSKHYEGDIIVTKLHQIRCGEWAFGEIIDWSMALENRMKEAHIDSQVQEEPDLERVEHTLMSIRKAHFN